MLGRLDAGEREVAAFEGGTKGERGDWVGAFRRRRHDGAQVCCAGSPEQRGERMALQG